MNDFNQERRLRSELLSRRYKSHPPNSETVINFSDNDFITNENKNLKSLHSNVDDLLAIGSSTMSKLRDQRETLKGIHNRVFEMINQLGMSNTVMRLIENRAFKDKFILFGLMFVFVIFMLLVFLYFL